MHFDEPAGLRSPNVVQFEPLTSPRVELIKHTAAHSYRGAQKSPGKKDNTTIKVSENSVMKQDLANFTKYYP